MDSRYRKANNTIFLVEYIVLLLFTCYAILFDNYFIKDCIFLIVALTIFLIVERNMIVPSGMLVVAMVPILLQLLGIFFNLYSLFFIGIGYDKWIHLTNAICGTLIAFYIIKNKFKTRLPAIFIAAIFILGIGAILENGEFIGTQYLHYTGPTVFSQGDLLAHTTSDLQKYDTEWDILFNTAGVIIGGIIISLVRFGKNDNSKRRHNN